jgi:hypothetical protein
VVFSLNPFINSLEMIPSCGIVPQLKMVAACKTCPHASNFVVGLSRETSDS